MGGASTSIACISIFRSGLQVGVLSGPGHCTRSRYHLKPTKSVVRNFALGDGQLPSVQFQVDYSQTKVVVISCRFLLLDEATASRVVIVIVSRSDGWAGADAFRVGH